MWKNKYEALAKLYSQLRQEYLELLNKYKQLQLKANSAQEAVEKLERMQADMRVRLRYWFMNGDMSSIAF